VFENFLAEYRAGRTPNPDILCNREIKFRAFLDHAMTLGADAIATGHYARTRMTGDECWLLRGRDPDKDQSYFLYAVDEAALARSRFPVGELTKSGVRARAQAAGLAVHDKKDSTGICFIGERRFTEFLNRWLPTSPGEIVDLDGQVLGEHRGLMFHTIGQRHGLGIGGAGDPWYVAAKDLDSNRLYVVQGGSHPALYSQDLGAAIPHWIGTPPQLPLRCRASIRYRGTAADCRVTADGDVTRVSFDSPQFAVAPGQSVVFYQDERCLGGAIIEHADAVDRILGAGTRVAAG
jgi:tRNA-specific 2-thiouridylase